MDLRMMLSFSRVFPCVLAGSLIVAFAVTLPRCAKAQSTGEFVAVQTRTGVEVKTGPVAEAELPDAPEPQGVPAPVPVSAQAPSTSTTPQTASDASATSSSSQDQAPAQASTDPNQGDKKPVVGPKSRQEIAEEQLSQEKKQRLFGFLPIFNTSYVNDAVSLTWRQKFKLAFAQTTDPVQFGIAGFAAGLDEAEGGDYGYGGGPVGYLKRVGADYLDSFDGNMIGNALLPSILHQDPRYFRRGYGSVARRMWYSVQTGFVCRHDVTGRLEPNYSNVLGNLAGGAISNLYVPKGDRGVDNVFQGAALVLVEGAVGSILEEFWPDISRHYFHYDPTHGQDAINRAKQN
jgi:hypothetical protein